MRETEKEVHSNMREHPEFAEIGKRMLQEWQTGAATSLRG